MEKKFLCPLRLAARQVSTTANPPLSQSTQIAKEPGRGNLIVEPDRFDVRCNASPHLFQERRHIDVLSLHLALMEIELMLEALVERCGTLVAVAFNMHANNGLFEFSQLLFELRPAA